MNDSFIDKKIKFIINVAYIFIIILICFFSIKYLLPIIFPFIFAIFLSYIVEPTVQVLNKQLKIKRSVCCAICIVIVIILVCSLIILLSTTLYTYLKSLTTSLPDHKEEINIFIENINKKENNSFFDKIVLIIYDYLKSFNFEKISTSRIFDNLIAYFSTIFKSLPQLMVTCIVTLVFSVFVSISFNDFKTFIIKQFSAKTQILLKEIKCSIICILKGYAKSYLILMLITFTELSIAFIIFKIKPAFALAFIISIIDILPIFGIGTVMIPWGIVSIIFGNYQTGAIVLSVYALVTIIRQIIEPKIIGTGLGIPPIVTIPAMFIGLKLFGVIGLFISPLIVTVIFDLKRQGYIRIFK